MSNHSRRAVLAGIAAAPALATPALALTGISADAELVELDRKLNPVPNRRKAFIISQYRSEPLAA
jgi:hypothetical protein